MTDKKLNLNEMKAWLRGGYNEPPVPPPLRDDMTEVELICHTLRYPSYWDKADKRAIESEYDVFVIVWKNMPLSTMQRKIQEITKLPLHKWGELNKVFAQPSLWFGQALAETVALKLEAGHSYQEALETTYSVCNNRKVVERLRDRLLCRKILPLDNLDTLEQIVTRNIVRHGLFADDGSFIGSDLTDSELAAKNEFNLNW